MNAIPGTPYRYDNPASVLIVLPLKVLHLWLSLPTFMFLAVLTAMLFRPPDLKSFPIDRVAFCALVLLLCLRLCINRQPVRTYPATRPLLALLLIGLWGALTQPYGPQAWSLFAAKWIVPFCLFHIAGLVFHDERSLRQLEIFLLMVLVYLSAISILWLIGAKSLIFPQFITDEGIGIHADRARGPFLQAVANGVCLNLLGLIALDSFRRRKLPWLVAAVLFFAVPLALLATKTRTVWISAALSVLVLAGFGSTPKLRRIALTWCVLATLGLGVLFIYRDGADSIAERALDREFQKGVVEYIVFGMEGADSLFNFGLDEPLVAPAQGQLLSKHLPSRPIHLVSEINRRPVQCAFCDRIHAGAVEK